MAQLQRAYYQERPRNYVLADGALAREDPTLFRHALSISFTPVYKERGLSQQAGHPSTHTFPQFFLCRIYKAARATRVSGLLYLRARVSLAGRLAKSPLWVAGLTFSLVKTLRRVNLPTRISFLIVSRPFISLASYHKVWQTDVL